MQANAHASRKGISNYRNTFIKKSNQRYKDHVTQDNKLFLSIKIEGQSIESKQLNQKIKSKKKQQRNSKSLSFQKKSSNLLFHKIKRQTSQPRGSNRDTKSINKQQQNSNKYYQRKKKKSKTQECEEKIQQKDHKIYNKNQFCLSKDEKVPITYPKLAYKQIRLDQQLSFNFKEVIDQFNKTKKEIVKRMQQSHEKNNERIFRKTFGNPNFYQFQQFVRQNYHVKHMRGTLNSFQSNYISNDQNHQREKQSKRCITQIQHNKKQTKLISIEQKKSMQVYIHDDKKSIQTTQRTDKKEPFLQIKRHLFSHTQRIATQKLEQKQKTEQKQKEKEKKKIDRMNKTTNLPNFFINYCQTPKQHEKIEPWATNNDNAHFCY